MSFDYQSGTWTPHTTSEHATDILNAINTVLQQNNVVIGGKLVQLVPSIGNVVWIICLAVGAIRAAYDQVLFAASKQFSISEASDQQIQSLLPLAGTSLIPGAYSLVTVRVTAASTGDVTILTGDMLPFGTVGNFLIVEGAVVPTSGFIDFLCQADVVGPIAATPGVLTAFVRTIPNLASVTNSAASIQGRDPETVQQIRQRILQGRTSDIGIDGTARAILSIQGITQAKVYFNFDPINNLVLPGAVTIPPRTAYILVVGSDETDVAIANAYALRMLAPTMGALSQIYTTLAGQQVAVNYAVATGQTIHVIVYYNDDLPFSVGFDALIQDIVASISLEIGQQVTAALVLQALIDFPYASITGAEVSLSGTGPWGNIAEVDANKVASFLTINIDVTAEP